MNKHKKTICNFCERGNLTYQVKNENQSNEPLWMGLMSDYKSWGIMIMWNKNSVKASYTINYCPMCGKKLEVEKPIAK